MTVQEVAGILAAFSRNWPGAGLFQGSAEQRKATVMIWWRCLEDIPFAAADQAAVEICKKNRYPPCIAEFRAEAEKAMTMQQKAARPIKRLKLKREV